MSIVKSLIEYHKMIPHPEGGHYVEVFKNKDVSHIYFLLEGHEHSHWHRITKNETVHFYSGDPLEIYTSEDGVDFETNQIGSNNNFIYSIKKNTWFAMKPKGKYSLIGCTVAPAFEFEDLELAPKDWKPSKFNLSLK
jgi:predicted cupin superfamily sugar epimerase